MTALPILELRVTITSADYDQLVGLFREGFGLPTRMEWDNEQGRGLILEAGSATVELFNEQQAATVDQIEAGRRISGQVRLAIQVKSLEAGIERLLANGAILVHPAVQTPWGDRNARLQTPDGLQLTLYEATEESA